MLWWWTWIFVAGFAVTMVFLVAISVAHGLDRMDRFEIAAISIDWLVLAINGVLLSLLFRRQLKASRGPRGDAYGLRVSRAEGPSESFIHSCAWKGNS